MRSMNWLVFAGAALLAGCNQPGGGGGGGGSVEPKTEEEKTFYALGLFEGQRVKVFSMTPHELAIMEAGLRDAANDAKPKVELSAYQSKLQELYTARQKVRDDKEKEKAKTVLDAAARESGAERTASGLVFKSLKPGTGASPAASDTVKVNYEGKLPDGTVFDSSYKRNQPAEFPLGGVIKCWTEGVQKMKIGEKAKLTCPSDIAYGERGSPPNIPGNATLVFEVELLEIKKVEAAPAMPPGMQMPPGMNPHAMPPGMNPHAMPPQGSAAPH